MSEALCLLDASVRALTVIMKIILIMLAIQGIFCRVPIMIISIKNAFAIFLFSSLVLGSPLLLAQELKISPEVEIRFSAYGEATFAYFNYEQNQTGDNGARADHRLVFDTTRFAPKIEVMLPLDFEVEAEIEFEHGGTGSTLELEYEEFGEYENEVEQGGEVIVEELYLQKEIAHRGHIKIGRFYNALGLLSDLHKPNELIAAGRPESETTMIPAVWDEMGVEGVIYLNPVKITAQVLNGLDSTGFSSQSWVSTGQQRRFYSANARGLAGVLRVDIRPVAGVMAGVSAYRGDSNANRPKPDLALDCDDDSSVAACGFLGGNVSIIGAHFVLDERHVRARASLLWGHLENAGAISERNKSLSNNLGVLRSAVAEQAVSAWAEVGVDVMSFIDDSKWRIEPHVRAEYYDTMFKVAPGQFDAPRYERFVAAAGVGVDYQNMILSRLTARHRSFGDDGIRSQWDVVLSTGFNF